MTHPDDTAPDLDPASHIAVQLHALIDWGQARLDDEHANRQICLEELLDHLAGVADRAAVS